MFAFINLDIGGNLVLNTMLNLGSEWKCESGNTKKAFEIKLKFKAEICKGNINLGVIIIHIEFNS